MRAKRQSELEQAELERRQERLRESHGQRVLALLGACNRQTQPAPHRRCTRTGSARSLQPANTTCTTPPLYAYWLCSEPATSKHNLHHTAAVRVLALLGACNRQTQPTPHRRCTRTGSARSLQPVNTTCTTPPLYAVAMGTKSNTVFQLDLFLRALRPVRTGLRPARFTQHPARITEKKIYIYIIYIYIYFLFLQNVIAVFVFSDSRCKNACKMLADLCPQDQILVVHA